MQVSEIMTRHPEVIQSTESIRVAVAKLYDNDIRHLPVLRSTELIGIISDRDLRGFASVSGDAHFGPLLDRPVSEVMSSSVISVSENDDVSELMDIFIEGKVGAVPVVDAHTNKLVGIVSYIDVLKALRGAVD